MIVSALIDVADEDGVLEAYGYQSEYHRCWCGVAERAAHACGLVQADLESELMHRIPTQEWCVRCILQSQAS